MLPTLINTALKNDDTAPVSISRDPPVIFLDIPVVWKTPSGDSQLLNLTARAFERAMAPVQLHTYQSGCPYEGLEPVKAAYVDFECNARELLAALRHLPRKYWKTPLPELPGWIRFFPKFTVLRKFMEMKPIRSEHQKIRNQYDVNMESTATLRLTNMSPYQI